jgi:3-oxoacyl-[acyl-carrier protein] reductase
MNRLEGRVAIVTGAARGIGRAITERFLQEGASVVACDVLPRVEQTAAELGDWGTVIPVIADLTSAEACAHVATEAARHGGPDIVVNNAGIARWAPFLDHSERDWDDTLAINLKAVFLMSQAAARLMVEHGRGGVILSTASNNGHVAEPEVAAYNASKAGVVLLTKTMAVELGPHGIRANCVSPGHVGPTDLALEGGASDDFIATLEAGIPLGRLGRLDEIAALFAFLASDEAAYMNGHSVIIDGGQTAGQ